MKDVIILVGEMGCGKTYWGTRLAKAMSATFFDGDDVVPPAMMKRVSCFLPLPKAMVDDYVHNHLAPAILQRTGEHLVVAQALYRKESRDYLEKYLKENGVDYVAYCYMGTTFWLNLKQLWSRPKGLRWVLYWLMNKPFFQKDGLCV